MVVVHMVMVVVVVAARYMYVGILVWKSMSMNDDDFEWFVGVGPRIWVALLK